MMGGGTTPPLVLTICSKTLVLKPLRQNPDGTSKFIIPNVNNEYMGKLSLRYFGPVVWETMLPEVYKRINALEKFKDDIKKWVPRCKCRLCKTYIAGVGFVETS